MITYAEVNKLINEEGYYVYKQPRLDCKNLAKKAISMCEENNYERGSVYKSPIANFKNNDLLSCVFNEFIYNVFAYNQCSPQDIFITYEYKNDISRNNYVHFDRLRSLKALMYLTDVKNDCGPFSLVPGSHIKGAEMRRSFAGLKDYEEKKNRIDIDYPDLPYTLKNICGDAGTVILFDSDIFHCGGNITDGNRRLVIRSHWYKDYNWRVNS